MEKDQSEKERIDRIKRIVEREIEKEIISKQDEVLEISEKIDKALRNLDILKYVATVNYYEHNSALTAKKICDQEEDSKDDKAQTQIHPCVKKLLPFRSNYVKSIGTGNHSYETRKSKKKNSVDGATSATVSKENDNSAHSLSGVSDVSATDTCNSSGVKKEANKQLPQYIPPLPNPDLVKEVVGSRRGGLSKVQHRIIIGNISKWIPPDTREDNSTHKWMVYIRNQDKEREKDVTRLIRKVRYFLHESYKPHDIIDVTSSPFHLTRRGWGEFPIRVQLHFHHPLNKPVDIIHNLKLDMTCSGVQTLGAETVVELCLHQSNSLSDASRASKARNAIVENEYANGKKTLERSDVFDGNLLNAAANGVKSERLAARETAARGEEEDGDDGEGEGGDRPRPAASSSSASSSPESEFAKTPVASNNGKLMLDRRKIQEIIDREHDYVKSDHSKSGEEVAGASELLKSTAVKTSASAYKNGAVFDARKLAPCVARRRGQGASGTEVSARRSEGDIFKSLKSAASKLEGETQSKYCMKMFRRGYLVDVIRRVHATGLRTVEDLVKWFFRRWPIVTRLASDPTYKHIHPYSCSSEDEFFRYNIGKQRSAEWFRAKAIQKILNSLKPLVPIEEDIWTTKQILMWSRFHGYSPASFARSVGGDDAEPGLERRRGSEHNCKRLKLNDSSSDTDCDSSDCAAKMGKATNSGKYVNGLSVAEKKRNFKRGRKKSSADESTFRRKSYRHVSTYSEENDVTRYGALEHRLLRCKSPTEIDVVNVEAAEAEAEEDVKTESFAAESASKRKESCVVISTTPADEIHVNKFVCRAARQIGIKLSNEEVVPGVLCDSAIRVISQATLAFVDELVRKSFAQAWLRNGDRAPASLESDDVLAAILEHPQFDLLTNRGLGVSPSIKTEI